MNGGRRARPFLRDSRHPVETALSESWMMNVHMKMHESSRGVKR